MSKVQTVLGQVDSSELGFTSMHEHVLTDISFNLEESRKALVPPANRFPPDLDADIKMEDLSFYQSGYFPLSQKVRNTNDEGLMRDEVKEFLTSGGQTMLDCSAPGIRPNIEGVKRISEATGVHVIACTGLYAEESWPEKYREMDVPAWANYMREEITTGIEGTDIKAGHIKVAVNKVTDRQMSFLEAASTVAEETGVSVTAHLGLKTNKDDSRETWRKLLSHGVKAERLILCHFQAYLQQHNLKMLLHDPDSWKPQLDYAREVLDRGFNICIDCFGLVWTQEQEFKTSANDAYKIAAICQLAAEGYADQIVIGMDIYMKIMTRRFGGHGYIRLLNYVIPTLKEMGVNDEDIYKISVRNPARILA